MKATNDSIRSLLESSGFPFQTAVSAQIRASEQHHNYFVALTEHPWKNRVTAESGFIDLVVENGPVRIVIECKRARGGLWLFTVPHGSDPNIEMARLQYQGGQVHNGVGEFLLSPPSYQSRECIIRGQDDDNWTLLERLGNRLLSSIDALMYEDSQIGSGDPGTYVYIPCIVTTAELVIAKVNPLQVSLEDGTAELFTPEAVPQLKFRKALVTNLSPQSNPASIEESNKDKERTILIINSVDLTNALKQIRINLHNRKSPKLW